MASGMSIDLSVGVFVGSDDGSKTARRIPGALYHVIARDNRRTTLFHDEADYQAYLASLERYRRRDRLRCYACILLANHVHLLVETGEEKRVLMILKQ
jgi:REP element-mobilizing transposase RayT